MKIQDYQKPRNENRLLTRKRRSIKKWNFHEVIGELEIKNQMKEKEIKFLRGK